MFTGIPDGWANELELIRVNSTHYIFGVNSMCIITMDFHSTHVFSMKRITMLISQLVGLSITQHIITHSAETRTNTR
jgi:hypothetical protein